MNTRQPVAAPGRRPTVGASARRAVGAVYLALAQHQAGVKPGPPLWQPPLWTWPWKWFMSATP